MKNLLIHLCVHAVMLRRQKVLSPITLLVSTRDRGCLSFTVSNLRYEKVRFVYTVMHFTLRISTCGPNTTDCRWKSTALLA